MSGSPSSNSENVAKNDDQELRRTIRCPLELDAQLIMPGGKSVMGKVENISAGGALIRTQGDVPEGSRVIVRIASIGHFSAIISRQDDTDVALEFNLRRDRAARLADRLICLTNKPKKKNERRLTIREKGQFHSTLTYEDGTQTECEVVDFSTSGAAIIIDPTPAVGDHVKLGQTHATVVRADHNSVALAFNRPADHS